jgi:hypothetical protein
MNFKYLVLSLLLLTYTSCVAQKVDVLVVGGGASGTAAGIQSARMNVKTMIAEETTWLGGMLTSAGVSAVDGNYKLPSGIFGEFKDSLVAHYGSASALQTGWVSNVLFEPSVGNSILKEMTGAEKNLSVSYNMIFKSAEKTTNGWRVTFSKNNVNEIVETKVLIDATELSDVAKACGVKYDIGMEARAVCGEDIAPETANNIVQDLTYVIILKNYGVNKTIPRPQGYDKSLFACSAQSANCTSPKPGQTVWSPDKMMTYGKLPNGKYMINWPIEGNDYYTNIIELSATERAAELEKAKNFSLCYLYYMQTELGFSTYGLDESQFPTADQFPMIPYHRESRRIQGMVRFNVNHVKNPYSQPEALYRTGIAVGDYPIDHHHKRYPEWEKLPELHFYPVPSYNVPLGALIPKDVDGLIVAEKSISVSNLLNGSTRLQPVVMQIGQAAGALAAMASNSATEVKAIPVRDLQKVLLESGVYLMPYLDLQKKDVHFKPIQRIGATGILKGEGKNVGWSNETWFNISKNVMVSELKAGLQEFESTFNWINTDSELSIEKAGLLIRDLSIYYQKEQINPEKIAADWISLGLTSYNLSRNITRNEFAVILDTYIQPFTLKQVDVSGKIISKVVDIKQDDFKVLIGEDIEIKSINVTKIQLFSENGKLLNSSTNNIIRSPKNKGVYILTINYDTNKMHSQKIIINS